MHFLIDWIFIIITTFLTYKSYKRVVYKSYSSVAFYVNLIIYIFCCLPILLNYLMGYPEYKALYWYRVFKQPMESELIAIIYDIYILISLLVLYRYGVKADKKLKSKHEVEIKTIKRSVNNKYLYFVILSLPLIYVIISGNFSKLFTYTSFAGRGMGGDQGFIMNSLILLSIYCLCIYVFSGQLSKGKIALLIIWSVILAWMQGKRFIIAVMAILYLFFITKANISDRVRKWLFRVLPIGGAAIIVFSGIYFVLIKPLSNMGFETVYDMLRVDFGRDDVIKYVIQKEFIQVDHILDYPGQSFVSTMLVFIPRVIWPLKPYSHYEYLTASILGVAINNLPAGTTPCWYEMCLCNFGYFGFFIGIVLLPVFCKFADNMKQVKSKSLVFMFILVLLTQNTDVYIIYIFLIFAYYIIEHVKHRKIILRKNRKSLSRS